MAISSHSRRLIRALTAVAVAAFGLVVPLSGSADAQTSFTFDGGGYGHGVGMSQWGAKGRADAGQSAEQILAAYYPNTALSARAGGTIRVHIDDTAATNVVLGAPTNWLVNGTNRAVSAGGDTVAVKASANRIVIQTVAPRSFAEVALAGPGDAVAIALAPGRPTRVESTGFRYHYGRLVFRLKSADTLEVTIDSMSMQQYLYGLAEVPSGWPAEAQKAQAIAGRTYAAMRQANPRTSTYDIVSTTFDQYYTGYEKEFGELGSRWVSAVDGTNDRVITFGGNPITAFYFSSSGGATENSEYVFANQLPYARAASDPYDNASGNGNYRWSRSYSGIELGAWISEARSVDLGTVTRLEYTGPFGASGRIDRAQIRVAGTKNSITITGLQLQIAINNGAPLNRQLLSTYVFIRPFGSYDAATFAPGGVRVGGWAFYPGSAAQVQVLVDDRLVATIPAGNDRPDVAATVPGAPPKSGFDAVIPIQSATSRVCLQTIVAGSSNSFPIGCKTVSVPTDPFGYLDSVRNVGNAVRVAGWAAEPQSAGPAEVHVYVDGVLAGGAVANRTREDLIPHIPAYGPNRGFDATFTASPGVRQVCAFVIDVGPGSNQLLGCRAVEVLPPNAARPVGYVDSAISANGKLAVAGWTFDPDGPNPIDVHAYIDGRLAGGLRANIARADIGAVFPAYGPNHGFAGSFDTTPGLHTICLYAINDGPQDHTLLGCPTVNVLPPGAAPPFGYLDVVERSNGTVRIAGWAIDPDTNAPIDVHIYVGATGTPVTANLSRTDVDAAFRQGDRHGYDVRLPISGNQRVCVYAINNNPAAASTLLGCRNA